MKKFRAETVALMLAAALVALVFLLAGSLRAHAQATTPANPQSFLALTGATTARTGGTLIANSATAGSVVVPSFSVSAYYRSAMISGIRLAVNDSTSTGWGGTVVDVDLWGFAPTFNNGDRGAFAVATGAVAGSGASGQTNHLGSFQCMMSGVNGDGVYSECAPVVGNVRIPANLGTIFWTARVDAASSTGVTGAGNFMYLSVEGLE